MDHPVIRVAGSAVHGRGVFATEPIEAGEVIEVCEVIVFSARDVAAVDETILYGFYFGWGDGGAIALGCGSLYNHSSEPNADYVKALESPAVRFVSTRKIDAGEEILVDYSRGGTQALWFVPNG